MLRHFSLLSVVLLLTPLMAAAAPGPDWRTITDPTTLGVLPWYAKRPPFKTPGLVAVLQNVRVTSWGLDKVPNNVVWYTIGTSHTLIKITDVTPDEHSFLYEAADVTAMMAIPSKEAVDAVVKHIANVQKGEVREALKFVVGARFAEVLPLKPDLPDPKEAVALRDLYRGSLVDDAKQIYKLKPADELPQFNEPVFFGNAQHGQLNLLPTLQAVEGRKPWPEASFKTESDQFAGAWHKGTLVLVRRPKESSATADIRFSERWMQAVEIKNKRTARTPLESTPFEREWKLGIE